MPGAFDYSLVCDFQPSDLKALQKLLDECRKEDTHSIPIYPRVLKSKGQRAIGVMVWDGKQLIAFCRPYFFYEKGCEIAMMVAPSFRRQGIARHCIHTILPQLQKEGISDLIFTTANLDFKAWLPHFDLAFQQSEYEMERTKKTTEKAGAQNITYKVATHADMQALFLVDQACFPDISKVSKQRLSQILNDSQYTIIAAFIDETLIGKAHLYWERQCARLSDIAIIPKWQGKGYGRSLIAKCIHFALDQNINHLFLDVETKNQRALQLYTSLGFKTTNRIDYWQGHLESFIRELNCSN